MLADYYDYDVADIQGTQTKTYVAKIIGESGQYQFKRHFLRLGGHKTEKGFHYIAELDPYGIYECSVTRYEDGEDGRYIGRTQKWFLKYRNEYFDLRRRDVLPVWRRLREHLREMGGAAT